MDQRTRSSLLPAVVGGLVSALVVCAFLAATGAFQDGPAGRQAERPVPSTTKTPSLREVFRRAHRAIVLVDHRPPGVKPRTGPPRHDDGVATGSGFVIDEEGHIVTNQHVVAGRGRTTVQLASHRDPVRATIVGRDASTDLALVEIDPARAARLTPLPLGSSDAVRPGDAAIAIGNPFGLERSLTVGIVSATGRRITAPDGSKVRNALQTDAPINPGNSGGPLLDAAGRVIGVISQGRGEGIAFAIPVDTVKELVARLLRRAARRAAGRSDTRSRG